MIVAAMIARDREDPENYLWLADAANVEARVAAACPSVANNVDNPEELLKLARTRITAALANYDRVLLRSPDNQDRLAGKVYALWVKALVEKTSGHNTAAFIANWHFLAYATARHQKILTRFYADPVTMWKIKATCRRRARR